MNLNEIKEIIKKDQGKFIIVEDGRPVMVILSFGDYQRILNLTPDFQKIGGGAEEKEKQESERFVPIGETIQETKEDFVSEPLSGKSSEDIFDEEDALPPDLSSEAERPPAGEAGSEAEEEAPSESEEQKGEPMKIEDLPF